MYEEKISIFRKKEKIFKIQMSSKRNNVGKIFDIREISINDARDYQIALNASKGFLENYLDWAILAVDYSLEQCKQVLVQMQETEMPYKNFAITFKGKLIGGIGFGPARKRDGLQITYWLSKKYSGKGLGKRALAKIIEKSLSYQDINFLEIHVDRANVASSRIAIGAGFKLTESYNYESKGLYGLGIMDVYILYTPKGIQEITISNSSQLNSVFFSINSLNSINWSNPKASDLVNTKIYKTSKRDIF